MIQAIGGIGIEAVLWKLNSTHHAYASAQSSGNRTEMVMIEWHMVILKYDTCACSAQAAAGNKRRSSFEMSLFRTCGGHVCVCVCARVAAVSSITASTVLMNRISRVSECNRTDFFLLLLRKFSCSACKQHTSTHFLSAVCHSKRDSRAHRNQRCKCVLKHVYVCVF